MIQTKKLIPGKCYIATSYTNKEYPGCICVFRVDWKAGRCYQTTTISEGRAPDFIGLRRACSWVDENTTICKYYRLKENEIEGVIAYLTLFRKVRAHADI